MALTLEDVEGGQAGGEKPKRVTVRITRETAVNGKKVKVGEVVEGSLSDLKYLIGRKKAVVVEDGAKDQIEKVEAKTAEPKK